MFTKMITGSCITFSLIASAAMPVRTYAQAYCALRDPVRQVYEMFPDATSYRSIVKTVGDRARDEVARRLPFGLHYNELGRHTLYVPVKGEIPLGVVHVRSEAGEWGLVEIAWAFDTDLRIVDFQFQRCRDRKRPIIESETFRAQIKGKDFAQLRAALSADAETLNPGGFNVPKEAEQLAVVVLRSVLKTMVVTDVVWARDLRTIRLLARSRTAFPNATGVLFIENPYPPGVLEELRRTLHTHSSDIDRRTVEVVRLTDKEDSTMGFVVRTDWSPNGTSYVVWWSVTAEGKIVEVDCVGRSPDRKTKQALDSLAGATLDQVSECATASELAAFEVLVICRLGAPAFATGEGWEKNKTAGP